MNKFRSVLVTFFICKLNPFFSCVSGNPESYDKNQNDLIDVHLDNLNPNDFIITRSQYVPALQIVPLDNKVINSILVWNETVWDKRETTYCKQITIFFNKHNKFIIILKTIENEQKRIYHISFTDRARYLGIVSSLYYLNPDLYTENISRTDKLDISDDFDKFYYRHFLREKDDRSFDNYKPVRNDKFISVYDKSYEIWNAENETNKEVGCKNVDIYTKATEFRFARLSLDDGNINFYKFDIVNNFWKKILKEEFYGSYSAFFFDELDYNTELKSSGSLNSNPENPTDCSNNVNTDSNMVINIEKKSDRFNYSTRNIVGDHFILINIKNKQPIDIIKYNDQVLFIGRLENFTITIVKNKKNDRLIQLVYSSGFQQMNILNFIFTGEGTWERIYQEDFIDFVQDTIGESKLHGFGCVDLYGIKHGVKIDDLNPEIKQKISKYTEQLKNLINFNSPVNSNSISTKPEGASGSEDGNIENGIISSSDKTNHEQVITEDNPNTNLPTFECNRLPTNSSEQPSHSFEVICTPINDENSELKETPKNKPEDKDKPIVESIDGNNVVKQPPTREVSEMIVETHDKPDNENKNDKKDKPKEVKKDDINKESPIKSDASEKNAIPLYDVPTVVLNHDNPEESIEVSSKFKSLPGDFPQHSHESKLTENIPVPNGSVIGNERSPIKPEGDTQDKLVSGENISGTYHSSKSHISLPKTNKDGTNNAENTVTEPTENNKHSITKPPVPTTGETKNSLPVPPQPTVVSHDAKKPENGEVHTKPTPITSNDINTSNKPTVVVNESGNQTEPRTTPSEEKKIKLDKHDINDRSPDQYPKDRLRNLQETIINSNIRMEKERQARKEEEEKKLKETQTKPNDEKPKKENVPQETTTNPNETIKKPTVIVTPETTTNPNESIKKPTVETSKEADNKPEVHDMTDKPKPESEKHVDKSKKIPTSPVIVQQETVPKPTTDPNLLGPKITVISSEPKNTDKKIPVKPTNGITPNPPVTDKPKNEKSPSPKPVDTNITETTSNSSYENTIPDSSHDSTTITHVELSLDGISQSQEEDEEESLRKRSGFITTSSIIAIMTAFAFVF